MWNCALRHCNVLYINSLVCFEHIRTNFCISAYSCRRERCFKLEVSSLLFSLHAVQVCQVVLYFLVLCICTCTCGTAASVRERRDQIQIICQTDGQRYSANRRQGQQGQNFAKAVGVVCRQLISSL